MTVQLPPPPVLSCARLLEYAVLDDSVGYAGRTFLFVGGKEVGGVPCLALCEDKSVSAVAVLLFLCDEESSDLGCSGFGSVTEARDWAERTYPGISSRRVQARVPEEDAQRYLDELFGDSRCSFCGRRPDQGIETLLGKDNVRICDRCINEFHAEIHKPDN